METLGVATTWHSWNHLQSTLKRSRYVYGQWKLSVKGDSWRLQIESDDIVAGFREMIEMVRMRQFLWKRSICPNTFLKGYDIIFRMDRISQAWAEPSFQRAHFQDMGERCTTGESTCTRNAQRSSYEEDDQAASIAKAWNVWGWIDAWICYKDVSMVEQYSGKKWWALWSREYIIHHPLCPLGCGNGSFYKGATRQWWTRQLYCQRVDTSCRWIASWTWSLGSCSQTEWEQMAPWLHRRSTTYAKEDTAHHWGSNSTIPSKASKDFTISQRQSK